MRKLRRELAEGLVSMSVCLAGDLVAALLVVGMLENFKEFPVLLILLPGLLDMRGNIFASLGARLGSALHLGSLSPKLLKENVLAVVVLSLWLSFLLGLLAHVAASLVGLESEFPLVVSIPLLTGFFSSLVLMPFTISLAFKSFRRGWDPDNVTAPLVTLAGDLVTIPLTRLALFLSLALVFFVQSLIAGLIALACYFALKLGREGKKIVKEGFFILFVCALVSLGAGLALVSEKEGLLTAAGVLAIAPGFCSRGGGLGGLLASRLSSQLYLGEFKPTFIPPSRVGREFLLVFLLSLYVHAVLAALCYFINLGVGVELPLLNTLVAISLGGLVLVGLTCLVTYYLTIFSLRAGLDPDNISIPLLTSFVDFLGVSCLLTFASACGLL